MRFTTSGKSIVADAHLELETLQNQACAVSKSQFKVFVASAFVENFARV